MPLPQTNWLAEVEQHLPEDKYRPARQVAAVVAALANDNGTLTMPRPTLVTTAADTFGVSRGSIKWGLRVLAGTHFLRTLDKPLVERGDFTWQLVGRA